MRTRRPQIGVRLAPHAAHAATAGPHAHSAHPGDRQQRRQDLQSAVALADENKLCGLITAAHSTMMLQPPHAGAGRRCRPCATRTRCARLAASSGDRCRARRSSDGCASPRLGSRRAATVASGIDRRRSARTSRTAYFGAVPGRYADLENTTSGAVLSSTQGLELADEGRRARHGFSLSFLAV